MRMLRLPGPLHMLSRGSFSVLLLVLPLLAMPASAKPKGAKPSATAASSPVLLPEEFAGWQVTGPVHQGTEPQIADAANAEVLNECGFRQFASGHYVSDGNKLDIRAIGFQDASGAYCAFTFYRRPGSLEERIGRTGAWDGSHALFWTGNTLVDATFDHLTAMSTAQLRELAGDIPQPGGVANIAPSLPAYLPHPDLIAGLTRYSLGSTGYVRSGGVLPPSLIGFDLSAEVVTASYTTHDGDGKLTLIEYPTPQMAAARLRTIEDFLKAGNTPQAAWPQPLSQSHADVLLTRRSGPIIAITSGSFPAATARKLLNQINYEANVVWNNPQGYVSDAAKVVKLFLGIFAIVGVLGGTALILGVFFGGGRALIRVLRGKPASAVNEAEIIRLNLSGSSDKER